MRGVRRPLMGQGSHQSKGGGHAPLCPPYATSAVPAIRHRPRRRAIQYSEVSVTEPRNRGVLDTPHARGTTTVNGARQSSKQRWWARSALPTLRDCPSTSLRGALATKQSILP